MIHSVDVGYLNPNNDVSYYASKWMLIMMLLVLLLLLMVLLLLLLLLLLLITVWLDNGNDNNIYVLYFVFLWDTERKLAYLFFSFFYHDWTAYSCYLLSCTFSFIYLFYKPIYWLSNLLFWFSYTHYFLDSAKEHLTNFSFLFISILFLPLVHSLLPGALEEPWLCAAAVMARHWAGAVRPEPLCIPPPVSTTEGLRKGPIPPHRSALTPLSVILLMLPPSLIR